MGHLEYTDNRAMCIICLANNYIDFELAKWYVRWIAARTIQN